MNESREELVSRLRSLGQSLGAVQETLDRLGEELAGVRSETGAQIASIRTFLESGQVGRLAGPDPAAGADLAKANDAIQKIVVGENQEQILEIYLEEAEAYVGRAALFVKKNDRYQPFKSLGFASENLEGLSIDSPEDPIWRAAAQKRIIYRSDDVMQTFPWLRGAGPEPAAAVLVPLVFQDEAPVVFYGDSDQGIGLDSLELLTHLTVLALKNNYLEWLLSEATAESPEAPAAAAPTAAEDTRPTPPPEFLEMPDFQEVGVVAPEEEKVPEVRGESEIDRVFESPPPVVEAAPEPEVKPEPEAKPAGGDFLADMSGVEAAAKDSRLPALELEPEPSPPEAKDEAPPEPPAIEAKPEPAVASEEMQRLHNDARRFARLLVSEIKLYNEDAVEQGRSKGDLYERLGRDIDRSRDVYRKRVHDAVAASEDHFHNELVRILARGQDSLMGPNYPGPQLR